MGAGARVVLSLGWSLARLRKFFPLIGVVFGNWWYCQQPGGCCESEVGGLVLVNKGAVLPISGVLGGGLVAWSFSLADSLMGSCGACDVEGSVVRLSGFGVQERQGRRLVGGTARLEWFAPRWSLMTETLQSWSVFV